MEPDSAESAKLTLDVGTVQAVYDQHAQSLERFLLGVLRNDAAAADALQATFIKLMEKGHTVQDPAAMKSWLFRVGFNEAMLVRRRESIGRKHSEGVAWQCEIRNHDGFSSRIGQGVDQLLHDEEMEIVRSALNELSDVQREVVEKRIYEGLKFREIADELDVPLGTVLARMQSSLKKLKPILVDRTNRET